MDIGNALEAELVKHRWGDAITICVAERVVTLEGRVLDAREKTALRVAAENSTERQVPLLPAIIGVTLARGARTMAANGVIVRGLEAIENLGGMDILCTDKTGTLTEGVIHLDGWMDADGLASDGVLLLARLNATLQSGMPNPLDEAIVAAPATDLREPAFVNATKCPTIFSASAFPSSSPRRRRRRC
ncbi:hypothetical protein [Neorhizobium sp. LjRoot104]|uniref:hypothetical protein n=1 Tax=Neorhizobium sp. LjRoot104 TaxID=3342254 RepID=UPI003ECE3E7C